MKKSKKKIILLIIAILLLFVIALVVILVKNDVFIDKNKLSNYGIDGISFKVPKNWDINKEGKNINFYPYKDNSAVLNVMSQNDIDFSEDKITSYYSIIKEMSESAEYFKLKEFEEKTYENFKGTYSVYNITLDNKYYECYLNMFLENSTNTLYSFNYCEEEKINIETKKQIDKILSTVKER